MQVFKVKAPAKEPLPCSRGFLVLYCSAKPEIHPAVWHSAADWSFCLFGDLSFGGDEKITDRGWVFQCNANHFRRIDDALFNPIAIFFVLGVKAKVA